MPDQWELYNLAHDPIENINLVMYDAAFPTPIASSGIPAGMTQAEVLTVANAMREKLARQEATLLSPYPSAYPTAPGSESRNQTATLTVWR